MSHHIFIKRHKYKCSSRVYETPTTLTPGRAISMCIYCGTTKYRKIYENHYDPIPKDETGRTYDIHHIDGNRKNNKPENLKAVTIQEHYDIHYAQRDWSACHRIAAKMNLSHEHLSELTKLHNKKMVENGTHPFLGGGWSKINSRKMVENGTHPWLSGEVQRKSNQDRIEAGTHHLLMRPDGSSQTKDRVTNGTHNWLGGEQVRARVESGTHHWLGGELQRKQIEEGTHPTQQEWKCEYCDKVGKGRSNYHRYHGMNCIYA